MCACALRVCVFYVTSARDTSGAKSSHTPTRATDVDCIVHKRIWAETKPHLELHDLQLQVTLHFGHISQPSKTLENGDPLTTMACRTQGQSCCNFRNALHQLVGKLQNNSACEFVHPNKEYSGVARPQGQEGGGLPPWCEQVFGPF